MKRETKKENQIDKEIDK